MNNIEVIFHGTDSLIVRSNRYSDIWNTIRLLNNNPLVSLSDVLVSLGLRPNEYDDMLSLPANQYYISSNYMQTFKITTFNDTSENNGFSYKFTFPEFMPVTTVIYEDESKTHVRKTEDDQNDYEKAFLLSWLYKTYGKKVVEKKLEEFQEEFKVEEPTKDDIVISAKAVAKRMNDFLKVSSKKYLG